TSSRSLSASTSVSPHLQARRRRERRELAGLDQQTAVLNLVVVLKESARRRTRSPRSVLVVHAAVAGAHEEPRLLEPTHGTPQVGAIDREHLELLALDAPDPAWNVIGIAIRDAGEGIVKRGQARLSFGELIQLAQLDPARVLPAISAKDRREQVP